MSTITCCSPMYGSCNAKMHTQILYFSLQTDGKTQNNWITMRPCSRSASTWISLHPVWRMHHAMSRLYITCARIASDTSVWCIIEMDFMQNWPPDRQTDRPKSVQRSRARAHIEALCTWTSKRLFDPLVRTKRRVLDRNRILFVCLNVDRMRLFASHEILGRGRTF